MRSTGTTLICVALVVLGGCTPEDSTLDATSGEGGSDVSGDSSDEPEEAGGPDDAALDAEQPGLQQETGAFQDAGIEGPEGSLPLDASSSADDEGGSSSGDPMDAAAEPNDSAIINVDAALDAGDASGQGNTTDAGSDAPGACSAPRSAAAAPLFVGHAARVVHISHTPTRIASIEHSGVWHLWDSSTGAPIARGEAICNWAGMLQTPLCPFELRGDLLAISRNEEWPPRTEVELRDANDGSLVATIPLNQEAHHTLMGVAADGSYVWVASATALRAYSRTGVSLLNRTGNYQNAQIIALPGELRVALGPAGADAIETIAIPSGSVQTAIFAGTFAGWFADGARFATTTTSNTVRIYSASVVQQKIVVVTSVAGLRGTGDYFWTGDDTFDTFRLYSMTGSGSPMIEREIGTGWVQSSRNFIALRQDTIGSPDSQIQVLDLKASTPAFASVELGLPISASYRTGNFAADGTDGWVVAVDGGGIVQKRATGGSLRTLGCGTIVDAALSPNGIWALATSVNQILIGDIQRREITRVIPLQASLVTLSSDGRYLLAKQSYGPNSGTRLIDLTTGTAIRDVPRPTQLYSNQVLDLVMARGAPRLAETTVPAQNMVSVRVTDFSGNTEYYALAEPTENGPAISPSGQRVSLSGNIYEGSALVGAASGNGMVWLNDDRLLLTSGAIVDAAGVNRGQFSVSVPVASGIDILHGGTRIFFGNVIYNVSNSAEVWRAPEFRNWNVLGAANDSHALYAFLGEILFTTHRQ